MKFRQVHYGEIKGGLHPIFLDCGGATYAKYTANRVINASSSCFATLWTTSTRIMEHCSTSKLRSCKLQFLHKRSLAFHLIDQYQYYDIKS